MPSTRSSHYTLVAIWLHWLIALMTILLMAAGIWMTDAIDARETQAFALEIYGLHKSFGLVILALTLFRLVWRFLHRPPDLVGGMPAWERFAALATQWLFYLLTIGLPISGWLMVSASPIGLPTLFFGEINVPHYPSFSRLDYGELELWESRFSEIHEFVAYGGIVLIILHGGAALRHHFLLADDTLKRMLPFQKSRTDASEHE